MKSVKQIIIIALLLIACSWALLPNFYRDNSIRDFNYTSNTPEEVTQIVLSPLDDLSKEEFGKEYKLIAKNFIFELGDECFLEHWDGIPPELWGRSKYATKETLSKRTDLLIGDMESVTSENRDELSLKGLRFFSSLCCLEIIGYHIYDIEELNYLPRSIREIIFENCTFDKSINEVGKHLSATNAKDIWFIGCNLENLDFLENFSSLSGYRLHFRKNRINDITAFGKFKGDRLELLDLSFNEIVDVSALAELNVTELNLENNRISDLQPFIKLNKITRLMIADNCILDYSIVEKQIGNYYRGFFVDVPYRYRNQVYRIDKHGSYNLYINGELMIEEEFGKVIFFNESSYINDEWDFFSEFKPACNVASLLKKFGGFAEYYIEEGVLVCELDGERYYFKDFSDEVVCGDTVYKMDFPMKRMQGDLPYATLMDLQRIFGFDMMKKRDNYYYVFDYMLKKEAVISDVDVFY